ncbi:MAG TPA: PDZ domain-containing protein [Planctomycetaceae bacterium]|nr:PDZ domain-containing protein [Planctomycetaceae bacterium]HIQ23219.1 PDZ domain-containing protein [Planctomycetota bacterium]
MTPIVKAVLGAKPSVVNIRGEKTMGVGRDWQGTMDAGRRVSGMGTGVVIDHRGYILTNHHVVDGVRQIVVTTAEGTEYRARLIARDPETDLAVIKIDPAEPLPVIRFGTSADLMPGETVVAVGNAYGYEHTVTQGIISALHRPVQVSDAQFYDDLIQTDASINPGNSGGPLLNIDGEMIGINVAVRAGAQGIGFAIPVDRVAAVAAKLMASANPKAAWHGIEVDVNPRREMSGAVVTAVEPSSPAAEVGVKPGDVITAVQTRLISGALDFYRAVLEIAPGEKLDLAIRRDAQQLQLALTAAEPSARTPSPVDRAWELFGLQLKPIPSDQFRRRHNTRYRGGMTVTAVRPDSPAAETGIRSGDVLVGMHIWETVKPEDVLYIIDRPDFESLLPLKFFVLRGRETLYGYLSIPGTRTAQR